MKSLGWRMAILTGILSIQVSSKHAGAQVKAEDPARGKIFAASVLRERQIELALSAAPAEVSSKATVYVLGLKGYERAREGTNGFSCLVGRSFVKPTETTIEPMCFDAEGSHTLLPVRLHEEELRSNGKSEAEIKADIASGYQEGRFKAPGKPGLLYMMSTENRLGPDPRTGGTAAFPPHLMFCAPYMTAKDLGYESVARLPFLVKPGQPDALMIVIPAAAMEKD